MLYQREDLLTPRVSTVVSLAQNDGTAQRDS